MSGREMGQKKKGSETWSWTDVSLREQIYPPFFFIINHLHIKIALFISYSTLEHTREAIPQGMEMNSNLTQLEICVVEDEPDLREEIVEALQEAGFGVRGYPGSRELYAGLLGAPCDIVILDIGLPGEDGFSIAERLHGLKKNIGIIMLTARSQIEERVKALRNGADAYLLKPVELQELLAVIDSLARRLPFVESPVVSEMPRFWSWSSDGWSLICPQGTPLQLTTQERTFLQRLWQEAGEAVSRDALAMAMGGDPHDYDFHRLDTLVSRLRRKATDLGLNLPLRAVRGFGYVFVPVAG